MKRLSVLFLLALLPLLTALFWRSAAAEPDAPLVQGALPTWAAIKQITTDVNSPSGGRGPVVVVSPDGSKVLIGFIRGDVGTVFVDPYFAVSSNNGDTWNGPFAIHVSNNVQSLHLDVVYDASNMAHAVWREGGANANLVYKRGSDWGSTVTPKVISSPGPSITRANYPQIVASSSNTLDVVWSEDLFPALPNTYHSRSINGGTNWSTKVAIVTPSVSNIPSLAVSPSGSSLYAVWDEDVGAGSAIYYAQGTAGSGSTVTWSTPIAITAAAPDFARKPAITLDGNTLHVSFSKLVGGDPQKELPGRLTCASQCTIASNWHEVGTTTQFVGVALNNPNENIVTDIVYNRGCAYVYYDGKAGGSSTNDIYGVSGCTNALDKITSGASQANNPSLATYGAWIHLAFEQKTSAIDPDYAHMYYVRGKLKMITYLPTVNRR